MTKDRPSFVNNNHYVTDEPTFHSRPYHVAY